MPDASPVVEGQNSKKPAESTGRAVCDDKLRNLRPLENNLARRQAEAVGDLGRRVLAGEEKSRSEGAASHDRRLSGKLQTYRPSSLPIRSRPCDCQVPVALSLRPTDCGRKAASRTDPGLFVRSVAVGSDLARHDWFRARPAGAGSAASFVHLGIVAAAAAPGDHAGADGVGWRGVAIHRAA